MRKLNKTIILLAVLSSFNVSASGGWKGKDPRSNVGFFDSFVVWLMGEGDNKK